EPPHAVGDHDHLFGLGDLRQDDIDAVVQVLAAIAVGRTPVVAVDEDRVRHRTGAARIQPYLQRHDDAAVERPYQLAPAALLVERGGGRAGTRRNGARG